MNIISQMDAAVWIWLVLLIVFVVGELMTVGLTSIWFAVGSLVSLILACLGANPIVQIVCFVVVSIVLLISTKPLASKYINKRTEKTNADSLIGKKAVITEEVNNLNQTGKTVVAGQEWTVRSEDDKSIFKEGETVEIVRISGVKLMVKENKED